MSDKITIAFQPLGKRIKVSPGLTALEAMQKAEIGIESPCGGLGVCGKCKIQIDGILTPPDSVETSFIYSDELKKGVRLACRTVLEKDTTVKILKESLLHNQIILTNTVLKTIEISPGIKKYALNLKPATLENQFSDMEAVLVELNKLRKTKTQCSNLQLIRELPEVLRKSAYRVTAVINGDCLIGLEYGDTTKNLYGIAFDIGTTTVVGTLFSLDTGREIAIASRMNPQIIYGENVIARINYSLTNPDGTEKLKNSVLSGLNEIIDEVTEKAEITRESVYEIVLVGNTTMNHLFFGISVEGLSKVPFVPVTTSPVTEKASVLGFNINPAGTAHFLPCIGGFVGADTVGVLISSDIHDSEKNILAIDIGTNGEIMLGNKDRILTCSTAAGPAFEGAHISFGMRASAGAISHIRADGEEIHLEVIGNKKPIGICGSGLIDAVAIMLNLGIIDYTGRIPDREEFLNEHPGRTGIAEKIIALENQNGFLLTEGIYVSQRDVREIQLAKGAIFAGIKILQKISGITDEDVSCIYLAGAFGNFIDPKNSRDIGLVSNLSLEKIVSIGNAALAGAKLCLLSEEYKKKAESVAGASEYIELSNEMEFQMIFADAMIFSNFMPA